MAYKFRDQEYMTTGILALIMSTRMLGLFMILPVFSTNAQQYAGVTIPLIGIAIGIYGLTQAIFQLPFGMLSDKMGRKSVIAIGLGLFILGSICAALSHHIYGIIVGRALQGAGAVGSTILATVSDLSREENRSKMMGIMGLAIGASFGIAMILGPLFNAWAGLSGIFWIMAGLAGVGIILLFFAVPEPIRWAEIHSSAATSLRLREILKNPQLSRLNASIFLLHAILTALFVVIPIILTKQLHLQSNQQMLLYLSVLILAFLLMLPLLITAEKKRKMKPIFIFAISALVVIQILLSFYYNNLWALFALLLLFFAVFSFLEAVLPSWVSKVTPILNKGAALGVFSSSQFFGIFIGGSLGGWFFSHWGLEAIFWLGASFALIWLGVVFFIQSPPYLSTVSFPMGGSSENILSELGNIPGVLEVAIMQAKQTIYFKIDQQIITKSQLHHLLEKSKLLSSDQVPQGEVGVQ